MFPGGRKRARESAKDCLLREIKQELPKLRLGQLKLWKEMKAKSAVLAEMSDAIFVAKRAPGHLTIGDKREIDKATWRKPFGIRRRSPAAYAREPPASVAFPHTMSRQSDAQPTSLRASVWRASFRNMQ
jgi:hypothetical protein